MLSIYFYYSPLCYKVVRVERPLGADDRGADIVSTLAHDFRASLTAPIRSHDSATLAELSAVAKDKQRLKTALHAHKNLRKDHPALAKSFRDDLIRAIVNAKTPRWGSFKLTPL